MESDKLFESSENYISFDLSNIKFCPGPCKDTTEEPDTTHNNCCYFKPYSGGKYSQFIYPIDEKKTLILKNLRICSSCHHRYLEFTEENYIEALKNDANIIIKKLKQNIKC
jgi:hypothetical protein